MKKVIVIAVVLFCSQNLLAQYSSKKMEETFNSTKYNKILVANFIKDKKDLGIDSLSKIFNNKSQTDSIKKLLSLKLRYLVLDTTDHVKDSLLATIDPLIYKTKKYYEYNQREINVIKRYIQDGHQKRFFPAMHGRETLKFFESDSVHVGLFRNNFINYSPASKQMVLNTEIVNDYFGIFRIGAGFQIKSDAKNDSLSTKDSTMNLNKKEDVITDLRNKGGDINVNVAIPFFQLGSSFTHLSIRSSIFNNIGFSLPVFNKATSDFILTNYTGVNITSFARGLLGKISLLLDFSTGYTFGNKNFNKAIENNNKNDPTAFWYNKASIGLDFKDSYRLQIDLYGGHSFVKTNFPSTVTFIIRPSK